MPESIQSNSDSATVWKWIAGLLVTIMLSVGGTMAATSRDTVSQKDFEQQLKPLETKIAALETRIQLREDHDDRESTKLQEEISQIDIDVARIAERMGLPPRPIKPVH